MSSEPDSFSFSPFSFAPFSTASFAFAPPSNDSHDPFDPFDPVPMLPNISCSLCFLHPDMSTRLSNHLPILSAYPESLKMKQS